MTRITQRGNIDESSNVNGGWLTVHKMQLKMSERMILFNMEELNDNASQKILYYQFLYLCRLKKTLAFGLGQILYCRSSHWITVSSVGCQPGELKVYDSLFDDIDDGTK